MTNIVTIRDETTGGGSHNEWSLECLTERITVRELIRSRVYQEVKDYNLQQPDEFRGLVQPTDAKISTNGFRLGSKRTIDWHEQYNKAIEAFEQKRFILLINEQQAESLEQEIEVKPSTEVTFLKLMPLVGG